MKRRRPVLLETYRLRPQLNKMSPVHKKIIDARATLKATDSPELAAKARELGLKALRALDDVVSSKLSSDVAKISAAQTILDRGFGRPTQTQITATVDGNAKTSEATEQELSRRTQEIITRIEAITRGKREKIKDPPKPADVRQLH